MIFLSDDCSYHVFITLVFLYFENKWEIKGQILQKGDSKIFFVEFYEYLFLSSQRERYGYFV